MCDPATMLALSVASSVTGMIGSQKQAKQQISATNAAALEQQNQINASSNLDQLERSRAGARERASMKVASGESGLMGSTPTMMLMDSLFQEGYSNSISDTNRRNSVTASRAENKARNVDASSRAQTLMQTGLQIGGAVVDYGIATEHPWLDKKVK